MGPQDLKRNLCLRRYPRYNNPTTGATPAMVALNKTYLKTLTPDRSAKDSGRRFYSPEISRWLNRDPMLAPGFLFTSAPGNQLWIPSLAAERSVIADYGFVDNDPVAHVDVLGLYNFGELGPYKETLEIRADGKKAHWFHPDGNWHMIRPGHGAPCCWRPATHTLSRWHSFSVFPFMTLNMGANLTFSGPYKQLVVLWTTCYRREGLFIPRIEAGYVPRCGNSLICKIYLHGFGESLWANYITSVKIAYLYCDQTGHWATRTDSDPVVFQGTITSGWTVQSGVSTFVP
jgi:hypothetical protein